MDRPPPNTEPAGESVLVSRALQGDRASLDELFLRYRSVAYRVAYRLLGNEADALDAVQDGFVNALTHVARFRAESSFKTWLLRVVSNAALDLGRSRRRRDQRAVDFPHWDDLGLMDANSPHPGSALDRADLRWQLDRALSQLPESQRQTFVLHADGGLTYQEVADVQGISIGTVMSRLFYARQRLKILLADQVLR